MTSLSTPPPPRYAALAWAADNLLRELIGYGAPNDVGPFGGEGIWPSSQFGMLRQQWEASLHELGHYLSILAARGDLSRWLRPRNVDEPALGALIARMTKAMADANEADAIAITSLTARHCAWPIEPMQIVDSASAIGNFAVFDRRVARWVVSEAMGTLKTHELSRLLAGELKERACRWEGLDRLPPPKAGSVRAALSKS